MFALGLCKPVDCSNIRSIAWFTTIFGQREWTKICLSLFSDQDDMTEAVAHI